MKDGHVEHLNTTVNINTLLRSDQN